MEIGTNISFLDRFDFEYNYSEKTTTGQVLPVDIPVEIGDLRMNTKMQDHLLQQHMSSL